MYLKNLYVKLANISWVRYFYFVFSMAIIFRIVCDYNLNRIGIHKGIVFPARMMNHDAQAYSLYFLFIEWLLALSGALVLNSSKKRLGAFLVILSYIMGMSQMFMNQKLLILISSIAIFIQPVSEANNPSNWFLRYQLILIYFFSAIQKMIEDFDNGDSMKKIFEYLSSSEKSFFLKSLLSEFSKPFYLKLFSYSTLFLELVIPLLIIKKPRIGIALVIYLHFSFNLLLKDIFPFSLTMLALSFLFMEKAQQSNIPIVIINDQVSGPRNNFH